MLSRPNERHRLLLRPVAACVAFVACMWAQDDAVANAVRALQSGNPTSAEQILRDALKAHPTDGPALEVLGVVLDQEKKFAEADQIYRKALVVSPRSPGLLNNYGNHLVSEGKTREARAAFLEVKALDASQPNATLQLARIALESKEPQMADRYLSQLPPDQLQRGDVAILRMQTDYLLDRHATANKLFEQLSAAAGEDSQQNFRLGVALSSVGEYEKAESLFAKTVRQEPDNTEALHDLGLAASHAGHDERARDALRVALEKQPNDVEVLYDLAAVDSRLNDKETALELLVRAHQAAPNRADVDSSLARTAADLGYFGDAANAWQEYLKLAPNDDVGRREHAFAETAIGQNADAAMTDLRSYVRKHPTDPLGHYELGTAETATDQQQALEELNRALTLKPDLPAARMARGLIYYRAGNAEAAVKDFEAAAEHEPHNAVVLDRLGETYLALNRTQDAVRTLQKAEDIAPQDTTVLLHLGRALSKTGDQVDAEKAFSRYRELGGARATLPHPAGLVDFLSLSPQEQRERYRAGVLRTLEKDPNNLEAQVRYLGLVVEDGKPDMVRQTADKIASLHPDAAHLEDAAAELMNGGEYAIAASLVEQCSQTTRLSPQLNLDLALAYLHLDQPQKSLQALDAVPGQSRTGDYYLALAEVLDSKNEQQKFQEALQRAIKLRLTRPQLCRDAALLFLSKDQIAEARQILDASANAFTDDPDVRVLHALTTSLSGAGESEFRQLERLWPDWPTVWMVEAAALGLKARPEDAKKGVQQALALAPNDAGLLRVQAEINTYSRGDASARQDLLASVKDLFTHSQAAR